MQSTGNLGYNEGNFRRNFKIPRKNESFFDNKSTGQLTTPSSNSYYNYQYNQASQQYHLQNYSSYFRSSGTYTSASSLAGTNVQLLPPPPPPPVQYNRGVAPITQNIYNTLNDIKEKPKNLRPSIFQQTVPDISDQSLPKELKALFQPLFCKLCSVHLSSNHVAKMHYKSKNHEKKIRKWLLLWSEKTGQPVPERAAVSTPGKNNENAESNPEWFHCKVCDLPLTGRLHAESHYMGKNHHQASMGYKNPSGQGYYKNGQWIRTKKQKSESFNFENGQDNFGMDFKAARMDSSGPPPAKKKKESAAPSKYRCEMCSVNATCQEQLETHFRGSKHLKKLKLAGLGSYNEQGLQIKTADTSSSGAPSVTDAVTNVDGNLSVYRTPSGDYYCPSCNTTTNSETQFLQHMSSKAHAKKAVSKKST